MIYLGLDLALSETGYSVIDGEHILALGSIKTAPGDPKPWRLKHIADSVIEIIRAHEPICITKEAMSFGSPHGALHMAEVHGAVSYAMCKAGAQEPYEVAPSTLKKFATGSGKGEKSDVKLAIYKRWGQDIKNNNQADAYVLARMAGGIHGGLPAALAYEKECIATVTRRKQ